MGREGYIDDGALARRGVAPAGALLALLGIWAGLIPFVGPYFDYAMGTTSTWEMTNDHFWLSVLPGAALLVGGLLVARGFARGTAGFGALLAFCAGLWLVIGPTFASLWKDGAIGGGPAFGSTGVRVAEWLGFYYGAGALGLLLSGYALGHLASAGLFTRRYARAATAGPATAVGGPATRDDGAREPVGTRRATGDPEVDAATGAGEPRRGRFLRRTRTRV
jgi:hypothetical protein